MPIKFKYDAAAVAPWSNQTTRRFGQSLVEQQLRDRQAERDRLLRLAQQQRQQQPVRTNWQWGGNNQKAIQQGGPQGGAIIQQGGQQRGFQLTTTADAQKQQQLEAERQRAFMEDARKQSSAMIMEDIKNGEFDPVTSRKLQQNLIAESEALGNPQLDATQRAEALEKIRAERTMLTANRMQKPAPPTRDEELRKFIGEDRWEMDRHLPWVPDGEGRFAIDKDRLAIEQQQQRPTSADEAFRADPKVRDKYMADAIAIETKGGEEPLTRESRKRASALARELYEEENGLGTPTLAPDPSARQSDYGNSSAAYYNTPNAPPPAQAVPGEAVSILEGAPAEQGMPAAPALPPTGDTTVMNDGRGPYPSPWLRGQPPVAQGSEQPVQPPVPQQIAPLPLTANSSSQNAVTGSGRKVPVDNMDSSQSSPKQQVKVGGKPLAVTPGTLTPQETAAKAQIMELPREERIKALMPYDPELKGRTIEQILEDPATKAQYAELTKQGLTTGNYREDMLTQMDEMLQHNVLNSAGQSKPDAYVGMRADEITDPKAKAEVSKLPHPKTKNDRTAIRSGQLYVDPEGVIRARS